jgi:hypothetical protein
LELIGLTYILPLSPETLHLFLRINHLRKLIFQFLKKRTRFSKKIILVCFDTQLLVHAKLVEKSNILLPPF